MVPIITPQQAVVGTISMDSLCLTQVSTAKTTFYAHEVNFLQGVGLCLGEVHHWISVHQRLLKVAQSALQWLHRRCPMLSKGEVYLVQPTHQRGWDQENEKGGVVGACRDDLYHLCLMLSTSPSKPAHENINKIVKLNENQFLDYLFECVGNSEPMSATVYGQHHLAFPIRDHTGCAVALVDIGMPFDQRPNPQQLSEITKVLKLLTSAFYKLSSEGRGREPSATVEGKKAANEEEENKLGTSLNNDCDGNRNATCGVYIDGMNESGVSDLPVLFDQLMLADLKEKMSRFDNR